eukprot:TRINITY_DN33956_c0_g1_i1.p1 TRINITY_DN33956_c0_g1~~TRINITY_DN33956_c0_g1_i1.p1  ORF type:complete len:149 (+),score=31.76 TRINITY_DN33956_c0_g1_i1:55-501(+)
MKLRVYQLDSFTTKVFEGNPACVVPLEGVEWLPDDVMQKISGENNASATAFFKKAGEEGGGKYDIRWFSPHRELKLCGHGTLATGYVLFELLEEEGGGVKFNSPSGLLEVRRDGKGLYTLDFPLKKAEVVADPPKALLEAMGVSSSAI